jgi:hypothetical protein
MGWTIGGRARPRWRRLPSPCTPWVWGRRLWRGRRSTTLYSLDELSALDDNCDECSGDEVEPAPTHYPPVPPPPVELRQWYVGRSPDGKFAEARLLSDAECSELSAVGFQLECFGSNAAGELQSRTAVASFVAEQAREARASAALAESLAQRARRGETGGRLGCSVKVRIAYVFHLCRRGFVNRR